MTRAHAVTCAGHVPGTCRRRPHPPYALLILATEGEPRAPRSRRGSVTDPCPSNVKCARHLVSSRGVPPYPHPLSPESGERGAVARTLRGSPSRQAGPGRILWIEPERDRSRYAPRLGSRRRVPDSTPLSPAAG